VTVGINNVGGVVLIVVEVDDGAPVKVRVGVRVPVGVIEGLFIVGVRLGPNVGTV